mgnify:CR=1 FL=1
MATDTKHSWELLHHIARNRKEHICKQCGLIRVQRCRDNGGKWATGGQWSTEYWRGEKHLATCGPCPGFDLESTAHAWTWDGKSPFRVCPKCGTQSVQAMPAEGVVVVAFMRANSGVWQFDYFSCSGKKPNA